MNKYIVKVTILATGKVVGYIVYGANTTEADDSFREAYSGLLDTDLYSYTIALSI